MATSKRRRVNDDEADEDDQAVEEQSARSNLRHSLVGKARPRMAAQAYNVRTSDPDLRSPLRMVVQLCRMMKMRKQMPLEQM